MSTGLQTTIALRGPAEEEEAVRSMALVPVPVNYRPHTGSKLISMILFIQFPGEPGIIIAFRANPISQPLILHQGFQCVSNPPASCLSSFQAVRRVQSTNLKEKDSQGQEM